VWYTVTSALLGGLEGAKDRLGEIRDLSMLRKRFIDYPQALVQHLQPMNSSRVSRQISLAQGPATDGKVRHINMSVMLHGF
jgi:hypothetical protein